MNAFQMACIRLQASKPCMRFTSIPQVPCTCAWGPIERAESEAVSYRLQDFFLNRCLGSADHHSVVRVTHDNCLIAPELLTCFIESVNFSLQTFAAFAVLPALRMLLLCCLGLKGPNKPSMVSCSGKRPVSHPHSCIFQNFQLAPVAEQVLMTHVQELAGSCCRAVSSVEDHKGSVTPGIRHRVITGS